MPKGNDDVKDVTTEDCSDVVDKVGGVDSKEKIVDIKENDGYAGLIKDLRSENAKKRIDNKRLKESLHSVEEVVQQVQAKFNKRLIRAELKVEALKAGLVDIDAIKMFDTSNIETTDDGDIVGISELIESMRTSKPYLFKSAGVADTTAKVKAPGKAKATIKLAKDMTDEEFERAVEAEVAAFE